MRAGPGFNRTLMAWEQRRNSRTKYYYRSRRLADGTVHKTYIGTGPAAEVAANADQAQRDEEARQAAQHRDMLADVHSAVTQIDRFIYICNIITDAALLAAGYHNHRSEWRRKRHGRHTS
jgi:hypothetical protein